MFVACLFATMNASQVSAQWSKPRIEIGAGAGRSGLAVPPSHPLTRYGPVGVVGVHLPLYPRLYVGVDATGWRMSEAGETSQTLFVLASTKLFFPRPDGISAMIGLGLARGRYASFQLPEPGDLPVVHRFAIGAGIGYEVPPGGPVSVGFYFRTMNTLGSWKQISSAPSVRRGNSVLTTGGLTLAWRKK